MNAIRPGSSCGLGVGAEEWPWSCSEAPLCPLRERGRLRDSDIINPIAYYLL